MSVAEHPAPRSAALHDPHPSKAQFRGLAARVALAREEERAAVARQLHDEIGQDLTVLKYELVHTSALLVEAGLPRHLIDRLQSLIGIVEVTTNLVRRIAHDLRPPALDHLGLAAAIEFEAGAIARQTGLRCRVSQLARGSTLDHPHSIAAFRVFQEAMTNITRHASASAVRIRLSESRGVFTMDIHDNGRGITKTEINGAASIGLLSMRESIEGLGGSLSIAGQRGRGTQIVVRFPLRQQPQRHRRRPRPASRRSQ
ncbi:MAG TPA: sensor histidine kinase [Vicinamibacterales bacterium]|nr:sensor histidine kinase [Vicinamibacterales bacterium]